MAYKTVAAPSVFNIGKSDDKLGVVKQYGEIIMRESAGGWQLVCIRKIPIIERPGCLGRLFGAKASTTFVNMLIFYQGAREASSVRAEMRAGIDASVQPLSEARLESSDESICAVNGSLSQLQQAEKDAQQTPAPAADGSPKLFDTPQRSDAPRGKTALYIAGCVLFAASVLIAVLLFMRNRGWRAQIATPAAVDTYLSQGDSEQPVSDAHADDTAFPDETPALIETPQITPLFEPTPTPPAATDPPEDQAAALESLVLEGASRYYQREELSDRSEYELTILRNGLFAMSGKKFSKNKEVIAFYEACDWYEPRYTSDADTRKHMNDYQLKNLDLIISIEIDKGYR